MSEIQTIFNNAEIDQKQLEKVKALIEPRCRYVIAITPRSGSTYLCDMIRSSKLLGLPGEILAPNSIIGNFKRIPGGTAEEYLSYAMRLRKTPNQIAGLKASWFQFRNFIEVMHDRSYLADFKYIYLTRSDLAAQAVSLYKATATKVFHTNKQHSADAIKQLEVLEYDYEKIRGWYNHLVTQENGWKSYFAETGQTPLSITYEDIDSDVLDVLKKIAQFVKVRPEKILLTNESKYSKVSDQRNAEWARRFAVEHGL